MHILNDIDILVVGNDYEVIYADIKNLADIKIISRESYGSIVSEPQDFRSSRDRKFLVFSNGRPNVLVIDTTDFSATKLLGKWVNSYKRSIYDIEISRNE